MLEIPDFTPRAPIDPAVIDHFRGVVPDDVVELWTQFGQGTWAEGFLRVIDPKHYADALADCLGKVTGQGVAIPLMVTGLGDLVTWEPGDGVSGILHRKERVVGLGSTLEGFVDLTVMDGAEQIDDDFDWKPYPDAVAAHGPLAFDESFIHVPLLSLGGARTAAGVKPRDTITGIQIMVEFQGVIEH
ncbi:DUF1851 domain-containing protein [Agrococcus versicolor]|uniref:DUF1851 domain-containing protein n=1 Tax=Agrococcus versicolor TaxID=501482 RepID=A0ABN3AY07_9MICO